MNPVILLSIILLTPVACAVLVLVFSRFANIRDAISLISAIVLFTAVCLLFPFAYSNSIELKLFNLFPEIAFKFRVESLGMLFATLASLLWIINTIYSIGYMRGNNEKHQTRFYLCFAIAISSTMGLSMSGNLLTLFIFYEILTLSTYPLVTHKGTMAAAKSGRVYLGVLLGSSIAFFLFAIIWTWSITKTLEFTPGGIFSKDVDPAALSILLLLYVFGIGKAAIMPMHRWLPAAMVAPTPVSALLHAVAVVKAGVFSITKIVIYIFSPGLLVKIPTTELVIYIAGFTIIIASWIAFKQTNLKRMLAYSTISQLSYIIMAAMLATPFAIIAAALHIVAHAFGKITLFFAAGSIYTASRKTELNQLNGIGKIMPWTMVAFTIGGLSMIGLPPLAGFISKWYLLMGAINVQSWFVLAVIIISTLLNAGYFLPIIYSAFFKSPPAGETEIKEAPLPIVIALVCTAGLTLIFFFFPTVFTTLTQSLKGIL